MFKLLDILKLLPAVGPVIAALPEFKSLWDTVASTFDEKDQATLQSAYIDLIEDNMLGHKRLQEKLRIASQA